MRTTTPDAGTRDPEQQATYVAEWRVERWMAAEGPVTVFGSTWDVEADPVFPSLDAVRAWVGSTCAELGVEPPRVQTRRGQQGRADYRPATATLHLPDRVDNNYGLLRSTVLHELAHHLTHGSGHDATFRAALVDLYRRAGAPTAAHLLNLAFWEGNLHV